MVKCLLKLYKKDLMAYAMSLEKDSHEAEDLLQDTVVHLIESKDLYEERGSLKAYAMIAMRRIFLNKIRRSKRYKSKLDIIYSNSTNCCADTSIDRVYLEQLYDRTSDKDLLTLKAQKYTFKEISKMYKKSSSSIERRYRKLIQEIEHDSCIR